MVRSDDGSESGAPQASPAFDIDEIDQLPINPKIERLTRYLALFGGVLIILAIAITLVSVTGRYLFDAPVPGDYELVEAICAVGIFLFFPYSHATGSNIAVTFFTAGLPRFQRRGLDLSHEAIFASVAALLAWRLGIGLTDRLASGESTILIGLPLWLPYSFAAGSMALLCVVCLARVLSAIGTTR